MRKGSVIIALGKFSVRTSNIPCSEDHLGYLPLRSNSPRSAAMGIFDRFRSQPLQEEQPATSSSPEFVGTDFQPAVSDRAQDFSQAQNLSPSEGLTNFSSSSGSEEGRLYNPYEGLNTAVDPRVLRSVYKLPSQPEFLFSEEATVHKRSWSENLTYYTGTGYLAGEGHHLYPLSCGSHSASFSQKIIAGVAALAGVE